MVISLRNDTAFRQLVSVGEVVTARRRKRVHPDPAPDDDCDPEHEYETWVNRGRGEPAVLDVRITPAEPFVWHPFDTDHPQAYLSGFGDADGWRNAIRETHGEIEAIVYVYHITKLADRRD